MTTLAITPNWKNKSAKFKGTVAAGEHVSVTILNDDGEGGEFIEDVSTLRLRVVNPCNGRTLAIFPEPVSEGETPETWDADLSPLRCTLNLNTVQMLKAVPPAANVPLLWVLDDYDNKTLYFKEQFPVEHWPRLRGEEEPTDLDNYKDIIADFNTRLTTAEENVATAAEKANAAAESVAAALDEEGHFRDSASASAAAAEGSATAAGSAATDAQTAYQSAEAWATGGSGGMPSEANNAKHYSEVAANAAEEAQAAKNYLDEHLPITSDFTEAGKAAEAKAVGDLVSAENRRAVGAEAALNGRITAEVTARETLAAAVGDNRQNLAAEIARAQGAEQGLENRKADKTTVAAAIQAEASRAQTAEQGLRGDVSSAQTAIADRYTKSEVDAKIAGVQTFGKVVVPTLPDLADADDKTIYLVPRADSEAPDLCDEYVVVEEAGVRRWERIGAKAVDLTLDNTVTRTSANGVKSSGIWAALWGALASLPTGFTSLYDWCVAQLAGKASTADATLTERGFSEWNILHTPLTAEQKAAFYDEDPTTAENDYAVTIRDTHLYVGEYWAADIVTSSDGLSATYDRGGVEAGEIWGPEGTVVATRTALQGYVLGSQTDKPLQIAGDYATKSQVDNKLDKSSEVWTVSYTDDGLHIADTAGVYYIDISPGGVKTNNPEAHNVYWPRSRGSLARLEDIAGTFSSSTTYAKDALVEHLGVLYRCVNPNGHTGAWVDADFTPATVEDVLAALRTGKADVSAIPYDRITITTGQLQDHAEQKVTLNAATTTLALPALTDLTGKVSDFGIDMVNGYAPDGTPTAASFQLDGTLGTDYNLIVPDGEDWSEMSTLAAGEMAVYYFTLSAFQIGDLPTWGVLKQVVTLVPVPVAP